MNKDPQALIKQVVDRTMVLLDHSFALTYPQIEVAFSILAAAQALQEVLEPKKPTLLSLLGDVVDLLDRMGVGFIHRTIEVGEYKITINKGNYL